LSVKRRSGARLSRAQLYRQINVRADERLRREASNK
jgi:hypothetical protein